MICWGKNIIAKENKKMLPKDSGVPKSFNSYFRSIPCNLYLFKYLGAPLGNITSFSTRIG